MYIMLLNIDIRSLEILYERDLDSCCSSMPNKIADFVSTFAVLVVCICNASSASFANRYVKIINVTSLIINAVLLYHTIILTLAHER